MPSWWTSPWSRPVICSADRRAIDRLRQRRGSLLWRDGAGGLGMTHHERCTSAARMGLPDGSRQDGAPFHMVAEEVDRGLPKPPPALACSGKQAGKTIAERSRRRARRSARANISQRPRT